MTKYLIIIILIISSNLSAKIIDVFLFHNEYEILEIRLNELYDHVDKFVIVEFNETFKGNKKEFNYPKIASYLKKFDDKILYFPIDQHYETNDPWKREYFQRSYINFVLNKICENHDVIMLSDVDEIPHAETIKKMSDLISSGKEIFVSAYFNMYQFFLNRYAGLFDCTLWTSWEFFKKHDAQTMREARRYWGFPKTIEKGWHLTSMGGNLRVIQKIKDYSHSEEEVNEVSQDPKDSPITEETINKIRRRLPIVEIDQTFPEFIYKNLEYMDKLGLIDHDLIYQP